MLPHDPVRGRRYGAGCYRRAAILSRISSSWGNPPIDFLSQTRSPSIQSL